MQIQAPIRAVLAPVTPLQQNCTIVWCVRTQKAAIIDPGGEVPRLLEALKAYKLTLEKIWITHGHLDHAGGAAALQEATGCPIEGPHPDDAFWIDEITTSGAKWGMPEARSFTPDRWLKEGDKVTVGALDFDILECPGHTPGSVVLFNNAHRFCFMGDVLFQGSVGRTDFPYGDHDTLIASIRDKLLPLGDDVAFLPGHGPASTIGEERRSNPFLAGAS